MKGGLVNAIAGAGVLDNLLELAKAKDSAGVDVAKPYLGIVCANSGELALRGAQSSVYERIRR